MGRYDGKRVVITGGTSGVGLATAKILLGDGARVLVTGHSEPSLEAARAELGADGLVVRSDTSSLADMDELAERVHADLGAIDLLFANAGVTRYIPFESMDEASYDELFAVNAKGPYFTVQKLAPLMVEGGSVVVTTSVANVKGLPMISGYAASKAAVRSMVRGLARELLPRGVRVNAVSLGPIDTSILERTMPADEAERTRRQMTDNNPMQRFGRPEEVARAVAFLAFDATFTTGAELTVDGGVSQL